MTVSRKYDRAIAELGHETCRGCKAVIDPETCECGEPIDGRAHDNHYPHPMGCICHTLTLEQKVENLK